MGYWGGEGERDPKDTCGRADAGINRRGFEHPRQRYLGRSSVFCILKRRKINFELGVDREKGRAVKSAKIPKRGDFIRLEQAEV